jgi:hypothetical protein
MCTCCKTQREAREKEMSHYFTTELGRMRTDELIARADRYRLAQNAKAVSADKAPTNRTRSRVYRRVLAAVGLSSVS